MPQDTTYNTVRYTHGDTVIYMTPDEIPDQQVRELVRQVMDNQKKEAEEGGFGEALLLCLATFFVFSIPVWGRYVQRFARYIRSKFVSRKKMEEVRPLLNEHFPYFRRLPDSNQNEFLRRVVLFKQFRKFKFQDVPRHEGICYLISASAVQLTFGLKDYQLSYFRRIHIMKGEYRHFFYATPFEGHTADGEIYFSWPHFKYGYEMPGDKSNLGLHEMAHALTWQCFYCGGRGDRHFRKTFADFSHIGRPLFARMQAGETNMLGRYAATNYDEFWATSVEVFFEQSAQMRKELPELYGVLCKLLKQDPAAAA